MGALYLARRVGAAGFVRPVAIKVIHDHLSQNKRFAKLFIDEAKVTARIDDPHVIRVEELGEQDGRYFLVMEYVHGLSLSQVIGVMRKRKKTIPVELAVAIAMQIAIGLHGAHEATDEKGEPLNVVHRDVSPGNIVISYTGYLRIIDFGIAKAKDAGMDTQTGSLRGKLCYMPPEQARSAKHVDRRADIYCVGLILWEMLAGKRLLDAKNELQLLQMIKEPPIVAPSTKGGGAAKIPAALDAVVLRCLAQNPDERPATGAELHKLLGEAFPDALKVMPSDISTLMKSVRELASVVQKDSEEDLYADEVRKTLTVFGKSNEAEESLESLDTQRLVPLDADQSTPSLSVIVDDEQQRTERMNISAIVRAIDQRQTVRLPSPSGNFPSSPPPHGADHEDATIRNAPAGGGIVLPFKLAPNALILVGVSLVALLLSTIIVVGLIIRDQKRANELAKIKAAAASPRGLGREPVEVRRILLPFVRSGGLSADEAQILRNACKELGDRQCYDEVSQRYPTP